MKNRVIFNLVNGGILAASAHSLPQDHFYKWHKLRRALEKQYLALDKEQKDLMKECGVTIEMLNLGEKERNLLPQEAQEAMDRFGALNEQLLDEDVQIKLPARIPVEFYKGIYDENRAVPIGGRYVDIFANMAVESAVMDYVFVEEGESDEN